MSWFWREMKTQMRNQLEILKCKNIICETKVNLMDNKYQNRHC